MLAAVERFVERLAVVALADGILRAFERVGGGRVLGGRVAVGARGARRVDGALRLVHLFVRGIAAGDKEDRGNDARGQPHGLPRAASRGHENLSISL